MDNEAIHGKKGTKWKAGDDLTLQIEGHASPGFAQLFFESYSVCWHSVQTCVFAYICRSPASWAQAQA